MFASRFAYWTIVGLATAVYLGVNVHFLYAVMPRRRAAFRRPMRAVVGHWLPQATVLASLVLLSQLVIGSLLLMSTVVVAALLANNKKFASLNEPLLPCDIAMSLRQWHVWRILGQYVRRDRSVLIVLPSALAVTVAVFAYEPWMFGRYFVTLALLSPWPVVIIFCPPRGQSRIIRMMAAQRIAALEWDVSASVAAGGFFPTFLRSMDNVPRPAIRSMNAAEARTVLAQKFGHTDGACSPSGRMPHIVVVLAEGFIDPRVLGIHVEPHPLLNYDEAVRRSAYSGLSRVPVFGGWTVRSEYSLLTGINARTFANNIGNPNSTLVCPATHSLPKHLKKLGYRTKFVHPYDRHFYGRCNVCGSLGFDDFLDEDDFADAPREGKYVSDVAVASRIEQELREAASPTFLFCVTIENHGPWDEEVLLPTAPYTVQPKLSAESCLTFTRYLRHLRSADQMIRRLTDMVAAAETPTILLLVGDHYPALMDLYRELKCAMYGPDTADASWMHTPYFLLSNMPAERREMNCDISFLSGLVLDCAGLNGDSFFRDNSAMRRQTNGNLYADPHSLLCQAYLRLSYEIAAFPERYVSTPRL
jgi:hypothetical protein